MSVPWAFSLLLSLALLPFSLHTLSPTRGGAVEPPRSDTDMEADNPTQTSRSPGMPTWAPVGLKVVRPKTDDFPPLPLGWPTGLRGHTLSSEETSTRDKFQGIIGEYADMLENPEPPPPHPPSPSETQPDTIVPTETAVLASRTDAEPRMSFSAQDQASGSGATERNIKGTDEPSSDGGPTGSGERPSPVEPSGTVQTDSPGFDTAPTPPVSATGGPEFTTDPYPHHRPSLTTDGGLSATDHSATTAQGDLQEGRPTVEDSGDERQDFTEKLANTWTTGNETGKGPGEEWQDNETNETFPLQDCNIDPIATPCNNSDQSWSPFYPEDIPSNQSLRPSVAISPPLFVPLYSDWNSAMATWGLAWEAHVYGLGSVFAVLGLISVLCLLGLPLRCPPGSPYFTLLHLLLLAAGGARAFSLLYDAYSHQERLPALGSLLLSEIPLPCLTSAFSLSFLLLSLRSRMHLSLSLSFPLSALPRPCLLICLSLLHFVASLGCVGVLQLLPDLPVLLLLPQGLFVSLSLLLSCSYLVFYCHVRGDTRNIYRLSDSGEGGGSPEMGRPAARCPFAEVVEWGRAAGAGVAGSLCLLGCGGLQLYGMLHALGLGGVSAGSGFQPWPWWGYQLGCRLCEVGVCLALSLIGTQPLLCHTNSSPPRTKINPRPGSWSRLPCVSPSGGPTLPPQGGEKSPVLPPHYHWSLAQDEKLVVCEVITNRQSEALPLYTLVDPPRNGLELAPHPCQNKTSIPPLLPNPPSPPGRPRGGVGSQSQSQLSSLDSLGLDTDSTVDLRPPSPIDLSRSIDQALYSETLFPHSLFSPPRMLHASSSLSLNSPSQGPSWPGHSSADSVLYRTSSCGDVDQDNPLSQTQPPQPECTLLGHAEPATSPDHWREGWRGSNSSSLCQASLSGSSQGLCSSPGAAARAHSSQPHITKGQTLSQSSLPRALTHLPHHRHYRTLSSGSQDSRGEGRLAGREDLSESRLLERDLAVQAEFINVCRQIDSLSVCSDTIDL